ncbi:MAG: alpha/beta hydrolase [Thaumarchaeota archaeon]|nr:alpha/beta hydrolase [Nitrosopumilus sp.]PHY03934.1 MAG: alpha/beta hydrolase [Nitrososphaerota archaeon]
MEEKIVEIDGNKIHYLESGSSKRTLVFLHGLGASSERWKYVLPFFETDFHIVVPDLIGFGYSDKPNTDYTIKFFSNFLEKFLVSLGIVQTSIVGSSLGGQIASDYTSSHSQYVEKLILVSPSGVMKQSTFALDSYIMAALYPSEQSAKNAFELMDGTGKKIPRDTIDGFVTRMKLPNAKFAFMSTLLGLKNSGIITEKLKKISSPTLVIWGSNDPVIPVNFADDFVSSITNCVFHEMSDCGHTPFVQEPELFASLVLAFLHDK